jgi:hypothetical protein
MVLRLKTRESRSPPGLLKAISKSSHHILRPRRNSRAAQSGPFCFLRADTKNIPGWSSTPRPCQSRGEKQSKGLPPRQKVIAGWSSPVARQAHNLKAAGSNPAPATKNTQKPRRQKRRGAFCRLGRSKGAPQSHQRQRERSRGILNRCPATVKARDLSVIIFGSGRLGSSAQKDPLRCPALASFRRRVFNEG